jgi:chromosome segregation ATPase
VQKVIDHFNSKTELIKEKFHTTDTILTKNTNEIENIEDDIKVLEKDFKSLCQTIGKHEYIVDKVFPEYLDLRDSIQHFKSKINEHLVTNNERVDKEERVTRNTTDDENNR